MLLFSASSGVLSELTDAPVTVFGPNCIPQPESGPILTSLGEQDRRGETDSAWRESRSYPVGSCEPYYIFPSTNTESLSSVPRTPQRERYKITDAQLSPGCAFADSCSLLNGA